MSKHKESKKEMEFQLSIDSKKHFTANLNITNKGDKYGAFYTIYNKIDSDIYEICTLNEIEVRKLVGILHTNNPDLFNF